MEQEPIKIEILDETPVKPEMEERKVAGAQRAVETAAQTAVTTAQSAWQSETRKKVTGKLSDGAARSAQFVQDRVAQAAADQARSQMQAARSRIQETDWKQLLRRRTAAALQWGSARLAQLADRVSASREKLPPAE